MAEPLQPKNKTVALDQSRTAPMSIHRPLNWFSTVFTSRHGP